MSIQTESSKQQTVDSSSELKSGRRRLLKVGATVAPIVLTLKSRSVLATGLTCTTPSAYGSINTSTPDKKYPCYGRTPGYWKQSQWFSQWPAPYFPTTVSGSGGHAATLFRDCFSPDQAVPGKTLLEAMSPELGNTTELGRHVSAALLNAAKGWTNGALDVATVKAMWTATCNGGFYEPTAGVKWYAAEVVIYLKSTMTL